MHDCMMELQEVLYTKSYFVLHVNRCSSFTVHAFFTPTALFWHSSSGCAIAARIRPEIHVGWIGERRAVGQLSALRRGSPFRPGPCTPS